MRQINYIYFHTAAADIANVDAAEIDEWHRKRGWDGIGYNYVIIDDRHDAANDGEVQKGRDDDRVPAHVYGANGDSLGICCVGHGDRRDFTPRQKESLVLLVAKLCKKHGVPVKNVLGHREVNRLVAEGKLPSNCRTTKTCPGKMVDTDEIRSLVAAALKQGGAAMASIDGAGPLAPVREALEVLAQNSELFGNARDEWAAFYNNGEVRGIMQT